MESAKKQWYVVHTYSGYEDRVKTNLESRKDTMGMTDYIFRAVVPATPEHEVKNGKDKIVMDKTFPGYVLVEMIMTDESWYIVRNTPGVTGFLGSHGQGSKPTPLLPDEVNYILNQQDNSEPKEKSIEANVGDTVTITDGAFSGLSGKITDIDEDNSKLSVSIDMFGRATNTELNFDQVKPVA